MAEWTNATVCKTVARKGYPGSNPGPDTKKFMTTGKRLLSKVAPYADLFSAAGNVYRTAILRLVIEKPVTPAEIAANLKISQPLVSHHLRLLKKSGWVVSERIGLHAYYSIKKSSFRTLEAFIRKSST
jgi:DNA-binding transcriptional ArsR family regulator